MIGNHHKGGPIIPHPSLRYLDVFVGRWNIQGVISTGLFSGTLTLAGEST